jgi:hypothetical protein
MSLVSLSCPSTVGSPLLYNLGNRHQAQQRANPTMGTRSAVRGIPRSAPRPSVESVESVGNGDSGAESEATVESLTSEVRMLRGDTERLAAAQATIRSLQAQLTTAQHEVDHLQSRLEGPEYIKQQVCLAVAVSTCASAMIGTSAFSKSRPCFMLGHDSSIAREGGAP